jgi:uncharacterized protein with ATP-grasp and redox domains
VDRALFDAYKPVSGIDAKSFAHFTIKERLPAILEQLMMDHQVETTSLKKLDGLKTNILHGKIENFPEDGPDADDWSKYLAPHLGKTWFEAPFYFAEAYFYRMILDATGYFNNSGDPFFRQKQSELQNGREKFNRLIKATESFSVQDQRTVLSELIQLNLWGNKADLSQLQLNLESHHDENTLINDSRLINDVLTGGISRLDIILDNSGMELFTDLLLAKWLLTLELAEKIILHAKAYPTFVSDATKNDVLCLLDQMEESAPDYTKHWAESLRYYMEMGRLQIATDPFWNAPLHFFEMPPDIYKSLSSADLIIFKGDANYRRIFGDRQIPYDTSARELSIYLPARSASIRILKSELMIGLGKDQVSEIQNTDANWLVNGKYGIIQCLNF